MGIVDYPHQKRGKILTKGGIVGSKLLWAGLTVIQAGQYFNLEPLVPKVGALIMIAGLILLFLDK